MKKTITALMASSLFAMFASAQPVQFGIAAGPIVSNYKVKLGGEDQSSDAQVGYTAGAFANIPAGSNFMIQPGLYFTQKGSQEKDNDSPVLSKESAVTQHIEMPVNLLYHSNGFFIGGGPSVAVAIAGKFKYVYGDQKLTENINFGNSEDDELRRFDMGANVLAGYQSRGGLMISVNYNQGFSNLMPVNEGDGKVTSHYFGLKVGYAFGRKK